MNKQQIYNINQMLNNVEDNEQPLSPVWPFPSSSTTGDQPSTNRSPRKINLIIEEDKEKTNEQCEEDFIKKYDQVKKYFV